MDIATRLPRRRKRSRAAKVRFATRTTWKVLKTTFAAGAVKGAAKARAGRPKRRLLPMLAAAGAGAAAVFAARRHIKSAAAEEEHHEAAPFPEPAPLRPAGEPDGSTSADPPVQALSDE